MRSKLPKVLQPLAGRPLLASRARVPRREPCMPDDVCVVHGHGADAVRAAFPGDRLRLGFAGGNSSARDTPCKQAMPGTPDDNRVLVLFGDVPLLTPRNPAAGSSTRCPRATVCRYADRGHGRTRRVTGVSFGTANSVTPDRRGKDASPEEKAVVEINTGVLVCPGDKLRGWLDNLGNDNAQGEYYLTDVIAMAVSDGVTVHGVKADHLDGSYGHQRQATTRGSGARVAGESAYDELMSEGVGFCRPRPCRHSRQARPAAVTCSSTSTPCSRATCAWAAGSDDRSQQRDPRQ